MSAVGARVAIFPADPWDKVDGNWVMSNRAYADVTCLTDSVNIRWGREDWTDDAFTPATATANLTVGDLPGFWPPETLVIGSWIQVWALDPVSQTLVPRFTGRMTDVQWQWSAHGADTPNLATVQVQAASRAAEIARTTLPAAPGHAYTVTEDAAIGEGTTALRNITGVSWGVPVVTGPGDQYVNQGNLLRFPDKDAGWTLAGWLTTLAEHMDARIWERCATAQIFYTTSSGRMQTLGNAGMANYRFELDACDLLADIGWTLTGEVVNSVTFSAPYQNPPIPDPVTTGDSTMAGLYGFWSSGNKEFWPADPAYSATVVGNMVNALLTRRRYPQWKASPLVIDTERLDDHKYSLLLHAEPMDTFRVTNLPGWSGTPGPLDYMRLEGWAETYRAEPDGFIHELALYVQAGIGAMVPPHGPSAGYRWQDVPPALTWDQVAPAITWDDVRQNTLNPDGTLNPAFN